MNPSVPNSSRRLATLALTILSLVALATLPASAGAATPVPKGPGLAEAKINALFELVHPGGLQKFARSVSTPGSPNYREYRSVKWIVNRYGAKKKAKKQALRWFDARGIEAQVDATGQRIIAGLDPEQAEKLLPSGASVSSAKDGGEGRVPGGLRGVVKDVGFLDTDPDKFRTAKPFPPQPPGSRFPQNTSARPHSGTAAGCEAGRAGARIPGYGPFTPNQYLDAYGHSTLHKQGFKGQGMRMAVVEIDGFKRSDLETYGKCHGIRIPPTPIILEGIKKPLAPGGETTLDLEVISAAAPRLKKIFVYQGGATEAGLLLSMGSALGKPGKQPDAISMSIGGCEPEMTGQIGFYRGVENVLAVAVGAGIPFFISTGDTGSAGCAFDGNSKALPLLAVQSPASSPFATAVGGSNIVLNKRNQIVDEFAWNEADLGMGGGVGGRSILAKKVPWYQRYKPFQKYGTTRAVPDIVAVADPIPGYAIYCTAPGADAGCTSADQPAGGFQSTGGTSAATPLMAGGMVLLKQKARKAGQAPIGFINPLLYRIGVSKAGKTAIRDITAGNNDTGPQIPAEAYGGESLGCCWAKPGFDLATGWGSLNLAEFGKVAARYAPGNSRK